MEEYDPPSPSMLIPLRMFRSGCGGKHNSGHQELAIVTTPPPPTNSITTLATTSHFQLPDDWAVEEVLRSDGCRVDKYYHEPGTGHKFRSLKEVERYLNGGEYNPRRVIRGSIYRKVTVSSGKNSSYRKMIVSGGKMLRLDDEDPNQYQLAIVNTSSNLPYRLPEGWIIEEVPRSHGGYVDKYYYEPGTGRKFRSLLEIERHLAELKENESLSETLAELKEYNTPLSKAFKLTSRVKNSTSSKKSSSREKVQSSTFNSPPTKINWVLASAGGDTWNPFISGSLVPESVKLQWMKRFMLAFNDGNYDEPSI